MTPFPPTAEQFTFVLHDIANCRCMCRGQCGRTGADRACADPDLTGRCRAEHMTPGTRSWEMIQLVPVVIDPHRPTVAGNIVALCPACAHAYTFPTRNRVAPTQPDLFTQGDR